MDSDDHLDTHIRVIPHMRSCAPGGGGPGGAGCPPWVVTKHTHLHPCSSARWRGPSGQHGY